jgi:hypothetical protein
MSTAAVSSNLINHRNESYFKTRLTDLKQLGSALASGNLEQAQTAYNNIETLGKSGPFGGNSFKIAQREQDFTAIGQALHSGNLAGAQQAFGALKTSLETKLDPPSAPNNPGVILNLRNSSGGSATEGSSSSGSANGTANGGISVSA